jgi:hypothetical protein
MVEFIEYKEEKLPIRISYHALAEYKRETGKDFDKSFASEGGIPMEMFEPLLFYSIESGFRAIGKEMKFDRKKDSFELLEECFFQFTEVITKFFPSEDQIAKKKVAPAVGNRQQRREAEKPVKKKKPIKAN